jgi:hypothetical protein
MPGVATSDALERKPAAISGAVFVNRFRGKFRTGRKKAATGPEQWAQAIAICLDHKQEKLAHAQTSYPASILRQVSSNS